MCVGQEPCAAERLRVGHVPGETLKAGVKPLSQEEPHDGRRRRFGGGKLRGSVANKILGQRCEV